MAWWLRPWPAALLLALLVVPVYLNSFRAELLFDDEPSLVDHAGIRTLVDSLRPPEAGGLTVAGRPLLSLSFALNYQLAGSDFWSYRAVNLGLHLLNGLLLAAVVRRALAAGVLAPRWAAHAPAIAFTAAALWLLHPLQTESVTYLVQRAESLVACCYLGTLWCFLRACAEPERRRWTWATIAACLAGMLAKEVMATAPLLLLAWDRCFVAGSWREVWRRRAALHLGCAATWLCLGALVWSVNGRGGTAGWGTAVSPWDYALTQFPAIAHYLRLVLWPAPLVLDYGTELVTAPAQVVPAALLVLGLVAACGWGLWRGRVWGFAGLFWFVVLAPTSSVIPIATQTMAEHRTYLPLAGLAVLAAGVVVTRLGRWRWLVVGAALAALGVLTWQRNADYASRIQLYEELVVHRPRNARAMVLLAEYHWKQGQLDRAQHWLERSLAVEPLAETMNNLGNLLQQRGDFAGARAWFERAVAAKPGDATVLVNLGSLLAAQGQPEEALAPLTTAVRVAPRLASARFNLANTLAQLGRFTAAEEQFRATVALAPDDVEARANLAAVLAAQQRGEAALAEMREALRRAPDNAALRNSAGGLFASLGRLREAAQEFEAAARLAPTNAEYRHNADLSARRLRESGGR